MNIEPLEARIAPASTIMFTDLDGDTVKVTSTLGDLTGKAAFIGNLTHSQLVRLDLTDPMFQGTSITTTVTKGPNGDGLVHIGRIDATGRDLASVTIKGDLGVIDAGDNDTSTAGLQLLSARSMGSFGLLSQAGGGDLLSDIKGPLGALKITGDVVDAQVSVTGGGIGSVTIGGSLIGGEEPGSGAVVSSGDMGPVKIARDLQGGGGVFSGAVQSSAGKIASVTIGGSLRGGDGSASGLLFSSSDMGAIRIGRDLVGGYGQQAGVISVGGNIQSLTIGGSLLGFLDLNAGDQNAFVFCSGNLGSVLIGGDVRGGHAQDSGQIGANQDIVSVKVGGSVLGGSGDGSGSIFANQDLGTVVVGHDLRGGPGVRAGSIFARLGEVTSVTIGGSVIAALGIGGAFEYTGAITSGTDIGTVTIRGDLYFGQVSAGATAGNLGSVIIGGSVVFGTIDAKGDIGSVTVRHDLRGGGIAASGDAARIRIGGSLVGEHFRVSRAAQPDIELGTILIGDDLSVLRIGGDMLGGRASDSGYIEADRILSAVIGGSMVAGMDDDSVADFVHNASIRAHHDIDTINVRGSLIGSESPDGITRVVISALGQEPQSVGRISDMAIRSLTVGGRVELADILAGFGPDEAGSAGSNGNASIGTALVGGDWIASNMSAGVRDAAGDGFANGDDYVISEPGVPILARIASITIKGAVIGAPSVAIHSGFTAEEIGFFKAGLYTAPLTAATETIIPPYTGNVAIREV